MIRQFFGGLLFLMSIMLVRPVWADSAAVVADAQSGFILVSDHATTPLPPASLTKLMTLYMVFSALDKGVITMDTELPISENAAAQPRSKLYVKAGETMTVREAVLALIIKSANDVAVVVAESLAPSEADFAKMMTAVASQMGLKDTVFKNASGLHVEGQVTTARDMAILTIALINHFPQYYSLFSEPSFKYKGKTYYSHNIVLQEYEGAEGLKTGYVSAVGYNIIATATQHDRRIISVVLGQQTALRRDLQAMRLLDKGFQKIKGQTIAEKKGQIAAFQNPLNRRAVIAPPIEQSYLPLIASSIRQMDKRVGKPVYLAQRLEAATAVEQGDSASEVWGVQVGAFDSQERAQQNAVRAKSLLGEKGITIKTPRRHPFYRSRLFGFERKTDAAHACDALEKHQIACFVVPPEAP